MKRGSIRKRLTGRSGRGDTCIASYMARRLSAPPHEAVIWAAALTSLKLEAEGPFRRDIRDVEALIRKKYSDPFPSSTPAALSSSPGRGENS